MTPSKNNPCCEKCEDHPVKRGFSSGVIRCFDTSCPCHTPKTTAPDAFEKEWAVYAEWFKLLGRLQGTIGVPIDPMATEERILNLICTLLTQARADTVAEVLAVLPEKHLEVGKIRDENMPYNIGVAGWNLYREEARTAISRLVDRENEK